MDNPCNLTAGYAPVTCDSNNAVGGVTGKVIIFTADVYSRLTITQDVVDGSITDIVLGMTPDVGYLFDLPRNTPKPTSPGAKGGDGGGYIHTVPFVIPSLSQEMKNWVASLVNRNLAVAAVQNLDNSDAYWELYGFQSLLEASVSDTQRANPDTGNGIMVTLTTPTDATKEFTMPLNINDGVSRTSTDDMMELLLTALP